MCIIYWIIETCLIFILINNKNVNEVKSVINLSTYALKEMTKEAAKSITAGSPLMETRSVLSNTSSCHIAIANG